MSHRRSGIPALALLAAVLATALAACGSSTNNSSEESEASTEKAATPAGLQEKPGENPEGQKLLGKKKGGVLTVYDHEDFEHLDPAEAYFVMDYEIMYATQTPLYEYMPNSANKLTPALAEDQPKITDGGKTMAIKIRHGVHFAPPIEREVTSKDVAYAIERGKNPNVANAYFAPYYGDIEGAEEAEGGPISGIETPNNYEIVFHLEKPTASLLYQALSLPLSMAVPREMAEPLDKHDPTTFGTEYLSATGPYMIKSNSEGKFLGIGYQPGKSMTLVRNPNWNPKADFRPAYLNEIKINIGGEESVIGQQVLKGKDVVQNDTPAQSIIELAYEHYPSQITFTPGAGDHYAALNNSHGPFKNPNLRRAFWAAIDRDAIVKARGGSLVAEPLTHFIYPGVSGYEQAGGAAGPKLDFNEHPEGDMKVAEKYMKKAGYPSGKYTGGETLQVVGSTGEPAESVAQIVNHTLQSLGFKTHLSLVEQAIMYEKYCGVPHEEVDVCPNVGWVRDFADPQSVLQVPFSGEAIVKENNSNWGQVNNPKINEEMKKAELVVGEPERAEAWAKVDNMLVEEAVAGPLEWDKQPNIEGSEVEGVNDLWNIGSWDYAFTSLKNP